MRKSAGFTLIELVIVIVILGILGAVAAPRFLNLQGDAYGANLNALKSSMESASTLVNTKAILAGKDKSANSLDAIEAGINDTKTVALVNGYPAATATGIIAVLDIDEDEYVYSEGGTEKDKFIYVSPTARNTIAGEEPAKACRVKYTNAEEGQRPEITIESGGC